MYSFRMQNHDNSICQLRTESSKQITIEVNWHKTYFDVTVFDGINAHTGTMHEDKIIEISNQLGIPVDDYMKECKSAFTTNGGCDGFIYTIMPDNTFQWKKVDSDIRINFGSIQLTTVPVLETLHEIINNAISNYYNLKENAIQLQNEKNTLDNDNKELMQRIEEYMHMKSDVEYELYNQFLVILNTKKKKIRKLEDLLRSYKIEGSTIVSDEDDKNTVADLYDCETEVETDSDECNDEENNRKTQGNRKTSNANVNYGKLTLSDSESEEVMVIPKRNRKKLSPRKLQEPEHRETKSNEIIKPKDQKQLVSKRNSNGGCQDEEPGPSGVKISKTNKIEDQKLKKFEDNKLDSVATVSIKTQNNTLTKPKSNSTATTGNCSSVDDILAGLLA